ncbi:sigma-70 family RNA polymerase sigma factor [Brevibacillus choshinensis]|uniref:sigma-70 family RNA polymerase sigma factor n=1 Tax=Brevibacillus choshinensis TaxID=54911 RepID=UPI002E1BEFFF|nr:sigma-70 family RNA polymerase sigma factor [Brevibacillus choshinensis]MED4581229.1 sigma-70 family RNA polymerase sigma factor [Brevibacillus choshinensis]MED4783014.1 sigma-70 family RNA polymerase sigma factor [Brevibacillus choshinensis]
MEDQKRLGELFEEHRSHLQAVAYRMLGSLCEADDAVQESWFRLSRSDTSHIENIGGWLTTVVSRICLDMLRSRKSRREEPWEAFLPNQNISQGEESDPEYEALLADSVGLALLVVLGNLNPAERISFVLHDIFDLPFQEIAPIVGRSQDATRQLASRARRRVQGVNSVTHPDITRQRELVDAFLAASRAGNFEALLSVLDPNVVLWDDREVAIDGTVKELRGAQAVAKQVAGRAQAARPVLVNGTVGVVVAPNGRLLFVLDFTVKNSKITEIELVSDPLRLCQLDLSVLSD